VAPARAALKEEELARELGMSRTPVGEARDFLLAQLRPGGEDEAA
jgi:DNA-binding GntR family transcriptional regulator